MNHELLTEDGEVPILEETDEEDRLLGLIAAMKDKILITFDYNDLMVGHEGGSMYVWDPETGKDLGGRMIMESASILELKEWLEAKADIYGVAA